MAVDLLGRKCVGPDCRWQGADGTMGCTEISCLQLDHVNNDGAKDRRESRYGRSDYRKIYLAIRGGSTRYQVLCANCNWLKKVAFEARYGHIGVN